MRVLTVGVSTGGLYALALAALYPERLLGAVACCAMTDVRFRTARETMHAAAVRAVWDAPDRATALRVAADALGEDGSKLLNVFSLAPSDIALFQDQSFLEGMPSAIAAQFTHGVEGYTDDRIADRDGWTCFDAAQIACPVIVLHGAADTVVDVIHAQHTAKLVPTAKLRIAEGLGHLSIYSQIIPALVELRSLSRAGHA
jgi:pimeloyl-ACP methyl ester carboxylesterase